MADINVNDPNIIKLNLRKVRAEFVLAWVFVQLRCSVTGGRTT